MVSAETKNTLLTLAHARDYAATIGPSVQNFMLASRKESAIILGREFDRNAAIDALAPWDMRLITTINAASMHEKTLLWYALVLNALEQASASQLSSIIQSWPHEFRVILPLLERYIRTGDVGLHEETEIAHLQDNVDLHEALSLFARENYVYEPEDISDATFIEHTKAHWLAILMKMPVQQLIHYTHSM